MKMRKLALLVVCMAQMVFMAGCASGSTTTDETRCYADAMTENILVAMNEDNYANFSQDFDDQMKNALTEENYNSTIPAIKARIGRYISKEFVSAEKKEQYTVVIYKAKLSDEPADVTVRAVFSDVDGKKYISGFWLDSPKLRGN